MLLKIKNKHLDLYNENTIEEETLVITENISYMFRGTLSLDKDIFLQTKDKQQIRFCFDTYEEGEQFIKNICKYIDQSEIIEIIA